MGYHLLRNQHRNGLDQSITVGIVCSALWHLYNAIEYIIISFIHNHIGKKLFLACAFCYFKTDVK